MLADLPEVAALAISPDDAMAHHALGTALHRAGRLAEAENHYLAALRRHPGLSAAWINLGITRQLAGLPAEAEACYRRAARFGASHAAVGPNLALALLEQGRPMEAAAACRAALDDDPASHPARLHLAMSLLQTGSVREGWEAYEARLAIEPAAEPDVPLLASVGDAAGRVVLVRCEQGFGDTLQFCRFLPALVPHAYKVLVQAPAAMTRLLRTLDPRLAILPDTDPPGGFDRQIRLLSLPRLLGPAAWEAPYLAPPQGRVAVWQRWRRRIGGRAVGLAWAGGHRPDNPHAQAIDRRRSIPPELLSPLRGAPVRFVALQPQQRPEGPPPLTLVDPTRHLADFAETAALICALDLVVTVDTAIAHLAGALGRPVWLLNRFDTCWRWGERGETTPWYPTMRLFRQPVPGDWPAVIRQVAAALR